MDLPRLGALGDRQFQMINFLNEVPLRYPQAISFAPGRPDEAHFLVGDHLGAITRYVAHLAARDGRSAERVLDSLGQYQRTNGIINDSICEFLRRDESIAVRPGDIMITNGCQEAMTIVLMGLFEPAHDVLVVPDPTYSGLTAMARLLGIEVYTIPAHSGSLDPADLASAVRHIRAEGKRPRGLYVVPDFDNPLGSSMPLEVRHELLALAADEQMLVFEDNPYGMFTYEGQRMPTLKSLDRHGVVLYLGTFSKILFPGLRIGFLVADQPVSKVGAPPVSLAEELSKVKSLISVNTSPLLQAVVGGVLIGAHYSLIELIEPKVRGCRRQRDAMLACLEDRFGADSSLAGLVQWSRPHGGYFLHLTLPFTFGEREVQICAEQYGVICCPMSFFSLNNARSNEVRLAFSYVSEQEIAEGARRLAQFVGHMCANQYYSKSTPDVKQSDDGR